MKSVPSRTKNFFPVVFKPHGTLKLFREPLKAPVPTSHMWVSEGKAESRLMEPFTELGA